MPPLLEALKDLKPVRPGPLLLESLPWRMGLFASMIEETLPGLPQANSGEKGKRSVEDLASEPLGSLIKVVLEPPLTKLCSVVNEFRGCF